MTRRRQLLQAGALGTAATFTTSLYAQTRPTVRWRHPVRWAIISLIDHPPATSG